SVMNVCVLFYRQMLTLPNVDRPGIRMSLLQGGLRCPVPSCGESGISPDKLVPNKKLREAVESFKRTLIQKGFTEEQLDSLPSAASFPEESIGTDERVSDHPLQDAAVLQSAAEGEPPREATLGEDESADR